MAESHKIDLTKPEPNNGLIWLDKDLSVSAEDYRTLRNYLTSRIKYSFNKTTFRAQNYDEIDRQLLGAINLKGRDKRRARENQVGKSAKVTDVNLALGQAQIDTAVTALLDMLVPTDKMYEPFGNAEQQSAALAVTSELNKSADKFSHINEYYKMFSDALRYDLGGCEVSWAKVYGSQLTSDELTGKALVVPNSLIFQGNRIRALDVRNTFYDLTVPPEKVSTNGSYAGYVDIIGISQLNEMVDSGDVNIDYVDDSWTPVNELIVYNFRPELRTPAVSEKETNRNSLDSLFGVSASPDKAIYLITMYIKLRGNRFKLASEPGQQVWKFTLIGDRIIGAKRLDNVHNRLPIVLASAT